MSAPVPAKVEVLTAEEAAALDEKEMDSTFRQLASRPRPYPVPRSIGRRNVEQAFLTAFELIGGTQRLAIWADQNTTEFYKLAARFVPQEMQHQGDVVMRMVLPRTKLDE